MMLKLHLLLILLNNSMDIVRAMYSPISRYMTGIAFCTAIAVTYAHEPIVQNAIIAQMLMLHVWILSQYMITRYLIALIQLFLYGSFSHFANFCFYIISVTLSGCMLFANTFLQSDRFSDIISTYMMISLMYVVSTALVDLYTDARSRIMQNMGCLSCVSPAGPKVEAQKHPQNRNFNAVMRRLHNRVARATHEFCRLNSNLDERTKNALDSIHAELEKHRQSIAQLNDESNQHCTMLSEINLDLQHTSALILNPSDIDYRWV